MFCGKNRTCLELSNRVEIPLPRFRQLGVPMSLIGHLQGKKMTYRIDLEEIPSETRLWLSIANYAAIM